MYDSLRVFTPQSPITMCIGSKINPLIKISADGYVSYFTTKKQKFAALMESNDLDKFIISWCGQYSTDVFVLNESDILQAIDELK
jgi:hypothetical protein